MRPVAFHRLTLGICIALFGAGHARVEWMIWHNFQIESNCRA